jgi:hypothetical protein
LAGPRRATSGDHHRHGAEDLQVTRREEGKPAAAYIDRNREFLKSRPLGVHTADLNGQGRFDPLLASSLVSLDFH